MKIQEDGTLASLRRNRPSLWRSFAQVALEADSAAFGKTYKSGSFSMNSGTYFSVYYCSKQNTLMCMHFKDDTHLLEDQDRIYKTRF